ncbi:MAG: hypothetical protein AAF739_00600 [Pseudomonadota bacterium]
MTARRSSVQLRGPLVALALCALCAQQLVGFVLVASPAMADDLAWTLCLSSSDSDQPGEKGLVSAELCDCIMHQTGAILSSGDPAVLVALGLAKQQSPLIGERPIGIYPTGPPPARGPPVFLI